MMSAMLTLGVQVGWAAAGGAAIRLTRAARAVLAGETIAAARAMATQVVITRILAFQ